MAENHSTQRIEQVLRRLIGYCRSEDWAGYDPYDALNSRWLRVAPFLDARMPRLALTQALKRCPVNVRPLLLIEKRQNPKALALALSASPAIVALGLAERELATHLIERIATSRSPNRPDWCWGYCFPWQGRGILVPAGAPNLVCTVFVIHALLDWHENVGDAACVEMALSAGRYIARDLYWESGKFAGFCYPREGARTTVHNANLLAAGALCRAARVGGAPGTRELALRAARYAAGCQRPDGSWPYGEGQHQDWIDNFHTGYNLCALRRIAEELGTDEFDAALRRGFAFYLAHFLRADGGVRYFHDRDWPVDSHCVAQSVLTLLRLRDLCPEGEAERLARAIVEWALAYLWDERRGCFYYRAGRRARTRISYMRWSQAWMLLALAKFVQAARLTQGEPQDLATVGRRGGV